MRRRSPYRRLIFLPMILVASSVLFFPVLVRGKGVVRDIQCAAQLKEIGRAIELYRGDYDGAYPYAVDASDKGVRTMWDASPDLKKQIAEMPMLSVALAGYVGSPDVFRCPMDNGSEILDNAPDTRFFTSPTMYGKYGMSYSYRTELAFRSRDIKGFQASERANVLFDACGHWHGDVRSLKQFESSDSFSEIATQYRYNVLMGDGRVERVGMSRLRRMWRERR